MSHGGIWRDSGVSRRRDIYRSWLHRLVRPLCLHFRLMGSWMRRIALFCSCSACSRIGTATLFWRHAKNGRGPKSHAGDLTGSRLAVIQKPCLSALLFRSHRRLSAGLTLKMSYTDAWRGACAARSVTSIRVSSIALLGVWLIFGVRSRARFMRRLALTHRPKRTGIGVACGQ
jgi:hypothetical protein